MPVSSADREALQTVMLNYAAAVDERDRARYASLEPARLVAIRGRKIVIGVQGRFHADRLQARRADLEALATRLFDAPASIEVETLGTSAAAGAATPARRASA